MESETILTEISKINSFYQSTICHVCKKYDSKLKRCSGCKLFTYCSREHQKFHWHDHKFFCKMVNVLLHKNGKNRQHVFDINGTASLTHDEWNKMKVDLKLLWEHLLSRSLTTGENQIWMFPRVCEICRESRQDFLIDCPLCYSVSYCCIDHQNIHKNIHEQYCSSLKLCYEINVYMFNNKPYTTPVPKYCSGLKILPENTEYFVKNYATRTKDCDYSDVLTGDIISPFLTIMYALDLNGFIKDCNFYKNSCVIHVVGAAEYEMNLPWAKICEFFFHSLMNLSDLLIILIGPELNSNKKQINNNDCQLCSNCAGKKYTVRFERCLYHDFVDSTMSVVTAADLIAAFNCGLHEYQKQDMEVGDCNDTWAKSIRCLTGGAVGMPLVITAYTVAEACTDFDRISYFCKNFQVLTECSKNPYGGTRPMRDWATQDSPVFYQNNYITILKITS